MRIRQQQSAEIRQTLLSMGVPLVTEQGCEKTTIDAVTPAAGVAKGTFYNYFRNKEDLVLAAPDTRGRLLVLYQAIPPAAFT